MPALPRLILIRVRRLTVKDDGDPLLRIDNRRDRSRPSGAEDSCCSAILGPIMASPRSHFPAQPTIDLRIDV